MKECPLCRIIDSLRQAMYLWEYRIWKCPKCYHTETYSASDSVYRCRDGEGYTYIDDKGVERYKSNLGEVIRHHD